MTTQEILQGVHDWTNGKIVYDISVAHPDGQGNPTKYADLAAALGTNGANIPQNLRKGGMSVKYAQSSDNKYVQYRLMSENFSIIPSDWQGIDDKPTIKSNNLVASGGVFNDINLDTNVVGLNYVSVINYSIGLDDTFIHYYNGTTPASPRYAISNTLTLLKGEAFYIKDLPIHDDVIAAVAIYANSQYVPVVLGEAGSKNYFYYAKEDSTLVICWDKTETSHIPVIEKYSINSDVFEKIENINDNLVGEAFYVIKNYYDVDTVNVGYLSNDGTVHSDATNYRYTDYIKVKTGDILQFKQPAIGAQLGCGYSKDKNKVLVALGDIKTTSDGITTVTIPYGVEYVRINFDASNEETFAVVINKNYTDKIEGYKYLLSLPSYTRDEELEDVKEDIESLNNDIQVTNERFEFLEDKNPFIVDNNLYVKETKVSGYLNNIGEHRSSDDYYYTDFIEVTYEQHIYFLSVMGAQAGCLYDSNKSFINSISSASVINNGISCVTIPNNVSYIRVNLPATYADNWFISRIPNHNYNVNSLKTLFGIKDKYEFSDIRYPFETVDINYYNASTKVSGYLNNIGEHRNSEYHYYTDLIPVYYNQKLYFLSSMGSQFGCAYGPTGAFVDSLFSISTVTDGICCITIPNNVSYIRVNLPAAYSDKWVITENENHNFENSNNSSILRTKDNYVLKTNIDEHLILKDLVYYINKCICIGDSVTEGAIGDDPHSAWKEGTSYPYRLSQMLGWTVENAGFSGINVTEWYNEKFNNYDFSEYQLALIELCFNQLYTDTINTDAPQAAAWVSGHSYAVGDAVTYDYCRFVCNTANTDDSFDYNKWTPDTSNYSNTYTGNYCKLIEAIKAENRNIFIVIIISQRRPDDYDAKYDVPRKIAQKYNIPTIDFTDTTIFNLSDIKYHGMSLGHAPNIDWSHFRPFGYMVKASAIRYYLGKIFDERAEEVSDSIY